MDTYIAMKKQTLENSTWKMNEYNTYNVKQEILTMINKRTKSPVKPKNGEWILILLECKSGNIERLLLRFCVEISSGNYVAMFNYRHRKRE